MRRLRRYAFGTLVLSLVAAVLTALLVVLTTIGGYDDWADGSTVAFDGREHEVELTRGATVLVWEWAGNATPACVVRDSASGADVALRPVDGWERPGGSMPYVAETAFTSPGRVSVRCERTSYEGSLHVERRPLLPGPVHLFAVPLALGVVALLAGVIAVGATLVERRSGQPEAAQVGGR